MLIFLYFYIYMTFSIIQNSLEINFTNLINVITLLNVFLTNAKLNITFSFCTL